MSEDIKLEAPVRVPVEEMDPSKIRVEVIPAAEGDVVGQESPEATAAQILGMYTPLFNNLVANLSGNAAKRVLNKLVEFPLNNKEYAPTSAEEQQAFQIGDRLNSAKFILIMHTYNENIEQIKNQADSMELAKQKKEE